MITTGHAGVIHRVMTRVAAVVAGSVLVPSPLSPVQQEETVAAAQGFLVEHATRLDPDQLTVAGRHLLARLRVDAGQEADRAEDRALAEAGLTLVQWGDGTWFLRGVLDQVGGAVLAAALDDGSPPAPAGPDGARDPRTPAQRRAEALVHVAEGYLIGDPGSAADGGRGDTTVPRARVTVAVDAATLLDPWAAGAAPGELTVPGCGDALGGHPLAPSTLDTVCCDAEVVPVLFAPDGAPLDVGRTQYPFPERIRVAIIARDRGCTFPHACARPPRWCQVHHLIPFSKGGATSERGGALVCVPAHRGIHRQGWAAHLHGDQVIWTPPARATRTTSRRRGHGREGPPRELTGPPRWKPGLDRLIHRWRHQLTTAPLERDTG